MNRFLAGLLALVLMIPAPAFAQTAAVLNPPVTTDQCAAWSDIYGTLHDSGVGCANHQVTVSDGSHGTMVLAPTNSVVANAPAILNNNSTASLPVYLMRSTTGSLDAGDFTCRRDANYAGGTFGWVNPCFTSYTVARAGSQSFEWSLLARIDNYATASDNSENVAAYLQARKYGTGKTWGFLPELIDTLANPTTSSVTDEHDLTVVGTDNNNQRVLLDGFARSYDGNPAEVGWGMRLNTDAHTTIKNGFVFNGSYINGLTFAPATISSAAVILGDGHAICFDTACQRKKFFSSGVTYQSVPSLGNVYSWSDAGLFSATSLNTTGGDILFGGSTASYPMLRRNATGIDAKLADNSGYAPLRSDYFVSNGGKYCLDITCVRSWNVSGGVLYWSTGSGNVASITDPGALTAASLNTSGGDVLFGGSTASYPMLRRNTTGVDAKLADNSGYAPLRADYFVSNGGRYCLDITCVRSWWVQGGVTYFNSASGNVASITDAGQVSGTSLNAGAGAITGGSVTATGTVQGATVTSTGNVILPTGGKICMNGAGCSIYVSFDGTSMVFFNGTAKLAVNMTSGNGGVAGSLTSGLNTGVTACSGITAATTLVNGGIVTHC